MEPPVVISRGRPREQRRKEEGNGTDDRRLEPEAKLLAIGTRPVALVGRYVLKKSQRRGVFLGKVVFYDCGLYRINYEDGDCEYLDSSDIRGILLSNSDFDDCLNQRRHKLDELILNNGLRIADRLEMSSAGANKVGCKREVLASSELQVKNDKVQVEGMVIHQVIQVRFQRIRILGLKLRHHLYHHCSCLHLQELLVCQSAMTRAFLIY